MLVAVKRTSVIRACRRRSYQLWHRRTRRIRYQPSPCDHSVSLLFQRRSRNHNAQHQILRYTYVVPCKQILLSTLIRCYSHCTICSNLYILYSKEEPCQGSSVVIYTIYLIESTAVKGFLSQSPLEGVHIPSESDFA